MGLLTKKEQKLQHLLDTGKEMNEEDKLTLFATHEITQAEIDRAKSIDDITEKLKAKKIELLEVVK